MIARSGCLVGIDVDEAIREHRHLTGAVYGLGEALPFRGGTFDLVSSNMVVEHITDIQGFLAEIRRVLKPEGRFVFHTPNHRYYLIFVASHVPEAIKKRIVWWLEKRSEQDIFVTYYRMNTIDDVRRSAARAGFEIETLRAIGSNGSFQNQGPLGLMECFVLKTLAVLGGGRFQPNLIACLRKPARE